jgi:predicted small lipoprotein YifL
MRKLFVFMFASLAVLSLGACAGKSPKAPPPPVVTKG